MPPIIALLTDFGIRDPYVGIMKGVLLTLCPHAQIVDLTHDVMPQRVRQAAYLLHTAYRHFPSPTVFLVVVDPGVGTSRHAVAVQTSHGRLVGPDNGVFSMVLEDEAVLASVRLSIPAASSETFHGRDVFAPAAASLACGMPIESLGSPAGQLMKLPGMDIAVSGKTLQGQIIHIDRFGNLITNLGVLRWRGNVLTLDRRGESAVTFDAARARIAIAGQQFYGIRHTYASVTIGESLAIVSSDGMLEIAVNGGSAAVQLGVSIGAQVTLEYS